MCNEVCHTVRENALTVNCSLIFKPKRQCIVHLFFPLTIKDKINISLMFKILHLRQGSFTRKVMTIFTLKIIVSIFVKLFLILVFTLKTIFYRKNFCEKGYWCTYIREFWQVCYLRIYLEWNTWQSCKIKQKCERQKLYISFEEGFTRNVSCTLH
jgi:hypothetical protein